MGRERKTLCGIPIKKIRAIDARTQDTRKITNEKPLKVNMPMEQLADLLMKTKNPNEGV
jgi:hypothetical protein